MLQRSPDALMASKYVLDAMRHEPKNPYVWKNLAAQITVR